MLPVKSLSHNMRLNIKTFLIKNNAIKIHNFRNFRSSAVVSNSEGVTSTEFAKSNAGKERDPAPYYFNPTIQQLLRQLTGLDLAKVYRTEPRPVKFEPPRYEFMTKQQLNKAMEDAEERASERLEFPPLLKEREPIDETLSYDPELQGYHKSKLVFMDITYGVSDKKRTMVVREPDGTLRRANWTERDKLIQLYLPVNKRKMGIPKMFLDENFEAVLNEEHYEFILDRACLQFEPDSAEFIKIYHKTFDHIDQRQKYDDIYSTRHYGPMVFYFAFYTNVDNILSHLVKNDRIDDAANVVRLYHRLNFESSKSAKTMTEESSPLLIVKEYVKLDALRRPNLELIIQTYEELQKSQQQYKESVKQAHGHS